MTAAGDVQQPDRQVSRPNRAVAVSLLVLAHLAALAGFLALSPATYPRDNHMTLLIAMVALPMSQCSLLAIWAALSRARSYVRFSVALLGIALALIVFVCLLENDYSDDTAGWATGFLVQAAGIFVAVSLSRLGRRRARREMNAPMGGGAPTWQFSLAALMIWVTLVAVVLSAARLAIQKLGWTADVFAWEYFFNCPILGCYNAVGALLVLAAVGRARRRYLLWVLGTCALIAPIGWTLSPLLQFLFAKDGGLTGPLSMTLALCQALYLFATLLPLRRCGCLGAPQYGTT